MIEIDRESHITEEGQDYDQERTHRLEGYGLKVVRFTNQQVLENFDSVCVAIEALSPLDPLLKKGEE